MSLISPGIAERRPVPAGAGGAGARRGDRYGTGRAIAFREAHPQSEGREVLSGTLGTDLRPTRIPDPTPREVANSL